MKILVKSKSVREESFTNKNGYQSTMYKQQAALDCGGDYPIPFEINVKQGQPYEPGEYVFGYETFKPSRFGSIEINQYSITLVPVGNKLRPAS